MAAPKALYALLSGATAAETITPLKLPQDPALPALTYQVISVVPTSAFGQDSGLERHRVQVDCWATTYTAVQALAAETDSALRRQRGLIGGVQVHDITLEGSGDDYEPDTGLYRVTQDYYFYITG